MNTINSEMLLVLYSILINIITFIIFTIDKKRAMEKKWRIPESRLLLVSFLGGSIGGLLGMMILRHKTKKPKFIFLMPILLVANIITWIMLTK